jgi:hypothetical protein
MRAEPITGARSSGLFKEAVSFEGKGELNHRSVGFGHSGPGYWANQADVEAVRAERKEFVNLAMFSSEDSVVIEELFAREEHPLTWGSQ